jgi:hypothetical protein
MRTKPAPNGKRIDANGAPRPLAAVTLKFVSLRPGDEPSGKPVEDVMATFRAAALLARAFLDVSDVINTGHHSDDINLGRDLNVLLKRFEKAMRQAGRVAILNGYTLQVDGPAPVPDKD